MMKIKNKELYIKAAQACINSYEGKYGKVKKVFENKPVWHKSKSVKWYHVLEPDKTLWIVFRGTYGKEGWENNFDYQQVRGNYYFPAYPADWFTHKGFERDCFMWCVYETTALSKIDWDNVDKLIVTGHSQGGSVALICAAALARSFDIHTICIALAPARVGNSVFKKYFRSLRASGILEAVILQNGWDTVCRVPPVIVPGIKYKEPDIFKLGKSTYRLLLYQHPVRRTRIGLNLWKWLLLFVPIVGQIIRWIGNPLDHYPQKYLEALKKEK